MKRYFTQIFLWSWVLTLPLMIAGSYLTYRTLDRFYTFQIRYDPRPAKFDLEGILRYEKDQLLQFLRVKSSFQHIFGQTTLPTINLFVSEPNQAQLESYLPQSGFEYVKGGIFIDGQLKKAKVKYRGDFSPHWAWDKKSIRVKTGKGTLFDGLRVFNLQVPKRRHQLHNYLSLKFAETLGLLAPHTEMVRLFLNGKDRGIHIFVEQPSETTLRNANLMPGDIYRGEIVGKDAFTINRVATKKKLFDSTSLWDKVAINNHYDPDSLAPLEKLLELIKGYKEEQSQILLSDIMDMEAWGRFSVFETLASTKHYSDSHNWRIYFDPWRGKFLPLVWDPVGWMWQDKLFTIVRSKLHELMFRNGDFLRARNAAFEEFFRSGKDAYFLELVSDTVQMMETEIKNDPFLRPGNVAKVSSGMDELRQQISEVFTLTKQRWSAGGTPYTKFHYHANTLDLLVGGNRPIQKLRMMFDANLNANITAKVNFSTPGGKKVVELSSRTTGADLNAIIFHASLLPDLEIEIETKGPRVIGGQLKTSPGYYQISLTGLDSDSRLTGVEIDWGNGWVPAQSVESITPTAFSQLYAPVAVNTVPPPMIWSGEVTVEGYQVLDQPLIIKPGTMVNLASGATVVLKHRLTAKGTPEAPIRFVPARADQDPWGAIVLSGRGADGSILSHCEMSDGSGLKGDLFEYSAMLSIHDVKNVVISDCSFKDNHTVDDMVHTVYTDIRFERVRFENALSDALDLDISTASISDSHFERSGNDAVDLMTTQAVITGSVFRNNGDKGISVGENSRLYAINNRLVGNFIGVQSKDRSTAVLLNQTLTDNKTALHAYNKNWRYGEGGTIFLGKSTVSGGETSAAAEKRSVIQIFDSYLEIPAEGKRVDTIVVDDDSSSATLQKDLFPASDMVDPRLIDQLQDIPPELLEQITPARRGSVTEG